MFCPKCARQQVSQGIHYCPGCGFRLTDVAEAVENDGLVDRKVTQNTTDLRRSTSVGIAAITLSSFFFVLSLILGTPEPSLFVQFNLLVGTLGFLFGLIWIGYIFWFKGRRTGATSSTRSIP